MDDVRCPACGEQSSASQTYVFKSARGQTQWVRCSRCSAYFLIERYDFNVEVVHTKKAAWGREDSGTELNLFKQRMFRSVIKLLSPLCPPPASLLDVGCSYGGFLLEAQQAGYRVSGFDIVPSAIEYVSSHSIPAEIAFSIGDLKRIPDGSLDVITCLDANYYWPDQRAELRHAHAKLKPGGFLAMRVVDKSWMFSLGLLLRRVSKKSGEKMLRSAVNDHRFSMPLGSLLKVIRDSGFEVKYASPRGALHSDQTRLPVKLSFALGTALWSIGAGMFAPGALILARKSS